MRRYREDSHGSHADSFPIPMRGNELFFGRSSHALRDEGFPIPMRGNESLARFLKTSALSFPIPMRGNEVFFIASARSGSYSVSDPHEG